MVLGTCNSICTYLRISSNIINHLKYTIMAATKKATAVKHQAAQSSVFGALALTILDTLVNTALELTVGQTLLNGKAVIKSVSPGQIVIEFTKIAGKKRTITIDSAK